MMFVPDGFANPLRFDSYSWPKHLPRPTRPVEESPLRGGLRLRVSYD